MDDRTPAERLQDIIVLRGGCLTRTEAEQVIQEALGASGGPMKLEYNHLVLKMEVDQRPEAVKSRIESMRQAVWGKALADGIIPFELPRLYEECVYDKTIFGYPEEALKLRMVLRGYPSSSREEASDGEAREEEGQEGRRRDDGDEPTRFV